MQTFDGKRVSRQWHRVLTEARKQGVRFLLTSGRRTLAEQRALFAQNMIRAGVPKPGRPLTAVPNPFAPHIRVGSQAHAIDVNSLDGGETRLERWIESQGADWRNTVPGEAWHGELTALALARLSRKIRLKNKREARAAKRRERERARREKAKKRKADLQRPARGIDVSNHQGVVDFKQVREAGYEFVWLKAGEGQDWTDPAFHRNVKAAKVAGLRVGAYHYLRPKPGRTGHVEARFFFQLLRDAGLGEGDLRPVLDVEETVLGRVATSEYARQALSELRRLTGIKPLFYTFPSFNGGSWPDIFATLADLWIANYDVMRPTLPPPWKSYAAWQHSSEWTVPGVRGHCDANRTARFKGLIA